MICSYLLIESSIPREFLGRRLPVLGCHGEADGVVPMSAGRNLVETLRSQGQDVAFLQKKWRLFKSASLNIENGGIAP
jgi:predicted esterase